ncbi:amidase family protein [Ottowia caeni]|uniref:amidase family protein n=1 Tax=Ottowia caeni TaxID=2870339 RepID=UPI001E564BB0|nr:hypothetical protein [Ottowia caeni]
MAGGRATAVQLAETALALARDPAVPETVVLDGMDAVVAAAFESACVKLQSAGALITRIAIPEFTEMASLHARRTLANAEAWAWHRTLLTERGAEYDPRVNGRIRAGGKMGAADYIDLIQARKRWITRVEMRIAGFDALIFPTVPVLAPPIAELQSCEEAYAAANGLILRNPTLINFLDGCALSLPCHAKGEPPVGLTLAGAGGRDREILALGLAVEQIIHAER